MRSIIIVIILLISGMVYSQQTYQQYRDSLQMIFDAKWKIKQDSINLVREQEARYIEERQPIVDQHKNYYVSTLAEAQNYRDLLRLLVSFGFKENLVKYEKGYQRTWYFKQEYIENYDDIYPYGCIEIIVLIERDYAFDITYNVIANYNLNCANH